MNTRLGKLRDIVAKRDLDALLVTNPENRRYLATKVEKMGHLIDLGEADE